jgi:2-C-methyl-D-erythritol 4-phosphate cytidylyltransferase
LEAFRKAFSSIEIVLVLPPDQISLWEKIREEHKINIDHKVVQGGGTRFQSVGNGLKEVKDIGLVAIHDGVRPLIKPDTIRKLFGAAAKKGNAIPYSLPADSIRLERKKTNVIIDRNSIRLIQTPQVFDTAMLKKAYQQKEDASFTDDASVFEKAGGEVHLVECPADNIKITRKEDLIIAEAIIQDASFKMKDSR